MEQADRDLLIRIDERLSEAKIEINDIKGDMKIFVREISSTLKTKPCQKNSERLKVHDKLLWVAVGAGVASMLKSFWSNIVT